MPATRQSARVATAASSGAEGSKKRTAVAKIPDQPKHSATKVKSASIAKSSNVDVPDLTIPLGEKEIECTLRPSKPSTNSSILVFTHGASGTNSTPAVANFADGFVQGKGSDEETPISSVICFQGSMNLKSRASMFSAIIEHCGGVLDGRIPDGGVSVLGGRSMGARAAVLAASESDQIKKLILVSYPLLGPKGDLRDQILLDISDDIEVLFISGSKDHMYDLEKLNDVRKRMKAKSWLVTVEGAGHGMDFTQKKRSPELQMITGRIAAEWANHGNVRQTAGDVGGMDDCEMAMHLPLTNDNNNQSSSKAAPGKKRQRTSTEIHEEPQSVKKSKKAKGK